MKRELLATLLDLRTRRVPAALVTRLEDGRQALITAETVEGNLSLSEAERAAVRQRMTAEDSGPLAEGSPLFVDLHIPPPRLAVVGAVHIAQHLLSMALRMGFDVTVIDPRGAFATAERFPGVPLLQDWPDEALTRLGLDARTAVVTLTHDPKLDDPALLTALAAPCFYIGALGSRKTDAARRARLREAGLDDTTLSRLHGGRVGLDIAAKTPAEIALSILAQVVAVRRGAGVERLALPSPASAHPSPEAVS